MHKYPIYKQDNNYSCGVFCIKMILKYYHLDINTREIKERCRLSVNGVSVYGMICCLKSYNIDAKAFSCDFKHLIEEVTFPAIILVNNEQLSHYVVVYRYKKGCFYLGDPDKGLVKITAATLKKHYLQICICINHVGRYIANLDEKSLSFRNFLLIHLKQNFCIILKLIILALLITFCSIIGSFYFQSLIDKIELLNEFQIVVFTIFFLGVNLLRIALSYCRRKLELIVKREINNEYVNKTVSRMLYLPLNYFNNNFEGVLLTKVDNLFSLSEFFLHFYMTVFMEGILLIGLLITLLSVSFLIGSIVIVVLMFVAGWAYWQLKKINRLNKKMIDAQEQMNQGYLEYFKNIYNHHQFFLRRFAQEKIGYLFDDYNYTYFLRDGQLNRMNFVSEMLLQVLAFTVVLITSIGYHLDFFSVGEIILFYLLTTYLVEPLFNVIAFLVEKDEILIIYERFCELQPRLQPKQIKLKGKIKEIKFDHITYSYGYQKPLIEHLDLTINKSLWLKGATGVGKSTLLKLLVKKDQVLKGKILINGKDINQLDQQALLAKIIYLDKEPVFYQENLRFNLLLNGKNEVLMQELLIKFGLAEYLEQLHLPLKIDGQPLSSGQCQIMMIIRAIILKPDVLILDEALSNVDDRRAKIILEYLNHLKIIVIIVAHQTKLVNEFYECAIIKDRKIYR